MSNENSFQSLNLDDCLLLQRLIKRKILWLTDKSKRKGTGLSLGNESIISVLFLSCYH